MKLIAAFAAIAVSQQKENQKTQFIQNFVLSRRKQVLLLPSFVDSTSILSTAVKMQILHMCKQSLTQAPKETNISRKTTKKTWENRDPDKIKNKPRGPAHWREVVRVECGGQGRARPQNSKPLGGYPLKKVTQNDNFNIYSDFREHH